MSHSTNAAELVTCEALGETLNELALQPRRHWLKKRQARTAYVIDLRKKIAHNIAKPFQMILAVAFADVDDGAPVDVVVAPLEQAIALVRARAARRTRATGLPFSVRLRALMRRETLAEGRLTALQLDVCAVPEDRDALCRLRQASREYRMVLNEIDALLDEHEAATQLDGTAA